MGRKAGRVGDQSGASRGRDQIPERSVPSPPSPPPQPEHAAAHANKGSMFLFHGGPGPRPSSLLPLPPPATPPIPPPRPAFWRGSCLCHSSRVSSSLAHQDTAWVRKDLSRLKKWVESGSHCSCVLSAAVANWQQGRVADVREDKGRHGPHQPPITAAFVSTVEPGEGFVSNLHAPPSQLQSLWPQPQA